MPVMTEHRIYTCREACKLHATGRLLDGSAALNALSYKDVLRALERGQNYVDILKVVCGTKPTLTQLKAGRRLLQQRLNFIRRSKGTVLGELGSVEELQEQWC